MQKNKVYIAVPTAGNPSVETIAWISKMKEREVLKKDVKIIISKGSPQNANVNTLVNDFLNNYKDCTHMLIINDDIIPDIDLVDKLLKRDKDVIGHAVAIWREEKGLMICAFRGEHGKQVDINFQKEPVGQCTWVGGACIMIKRKVLETIYHIYKHPIFWQEPNTSTGNVEIGSDERFCIMAKALGFQVWYDATGIIPQHIKVLLRGSFKDGKLKQEAVDTHNFGRKLTKKDVHGA